MWWCLDQTVTATRTSRQFCAHSPPRDTCFLGFLHILRSTRQIYTPPRDRDRNTGGPFGFGFSHFPLVPARETTRRRTALLSPFSFHSSRHATIISISMLDFFNQPFPRTAQQRRGRGGLLREREHRYLLGRARARMQVIAPDAHTPNAVSCIHHHACATRTSIVQHHTSYRPPPSPSLFLHSADFWQASFSPRGVGYNVESGPGSDDITRGGHRESCSLACFLDGLLYLYTYNSMRHMPPYCV